MKTVLRPIQLQATLIGQPLPWNLYTASGVLVAGEGIVISSEAHFQKLSVMTLYVDSSSMDDAGHGLHHTPPDRLDLAAKSLGDMVKPPYEWSLAADMRGLAEELLDIYRLDPDTCLGYVRRAKIPRPSVRHSLHVTFIALLLGENTGMDDERLLSLACAALTMNLAMMDLQDRLDKLPGPLNSADQAAIRAHPDTSTELLKLAGVTDADWLAAVRQHHENMNGSGYPDGLRAEAINLHARILRVADVYSAKITGRHYRPPLSTSTPMREIFGQMQTEVDAQICAQLLKLIGILTPGTLVRLVNGESACVTRRGRGNAQFAVSFMDARGRMLNPPQERPMQKTGFAVRGFLNEEPGWGLIDWKKLWGYE